MCAIGCGSASRNIVLRAARSSASISRPLASSSVPMTLTPVMFAPGFRISDTSFARTRSSDIDTTGIALVAAFTARPVASPKVATQPGAAPRVLLRVPAGDGEIAADFNNRRTSESNNGIPWDAQTVVSLIKHDALIRRHDLLLRAERVSAFIRRAASVSRQISGPRCGRGAMAKWSSFHAPAPVLKNRNNFFFGSLDNAI